MAHRRSVGNIPGRAARWTAALPAVGGPAVAPSPIAIAARRAVLGVVVAVVVATGKVGDGLCVVGITLTGLFAVAVGGALSLDLVVALGRRVRHFGSEADGTLC